MSTQNILFTDKYKPQTLNDIIVNKSKALQLKKILDVQKLDKANIIISGCHGIGKNTIVDIVLKELNYNNNDALIQLIKKKSTLQHILDNNMAYENMKKVINDISKTALVINSIEILSAKMEKKLLFSLCKYNSINKLFPLIIIIDKQHNKFINELRKICVEIICDIPTFENMQQIFNKIITCENINITDIKINNSLIKYAQNDIRRLINITQDIKTTYPNIPFDIKCYHKYINNTTKKDGEIKLYDATMMLLNENINIKQSLEMYMNDKVLLPLMVYENYTKNIFTRINLHKIQKSEHNLYLDKILDTTRTIGYYNSKADIVETNIYMDQSWINHNIHGIYTVCANSYILNANIPKGTDKHTITFNADIVKTSSKNINKKYNFMPLCDISGFNQINDIIYMNKLIKYLIDTNQYNIASQYCTYLYYKKNKIIDKKSKIPNLQDQITKYLDIILKIDKTNIN